MSIPAHRAPHRAPRAKPGRIFVTLRALVLPLIFAVPVFADAPTGGPDQQYESFIWSDETITDRYTQLVWERPSPPYPPKVTFVEAQEHCGALGGFRLPSMKELLTLVDEEPHREYEIDRLVVKYIDRNAFRGTPAAEYWTSSVKATSPMRLFTVDFGSGTVADALSDDKRHVRCVRL